ncbi:MAG TPA: pilin [Candidatus Doudnabacteria bacterium]|nr:pilin [Candidatus Doudnabacteria bacterium]
MKKYLLQISLIVAVGFGVLFSPLPAFGQQSCAELLRQVSDAGGGQETSLPRYCTVGELYNRITYWLYYIIGLAAVVSLIIGGYFYMTARDNEAQLKKAKSLIIWTIVGVVIALLATLIVRLVINLIVDNRLT